MENRTKFNLEENIEIWKLKLSENPNITKDNIDELESHLLDLIDSLESKGLNSEESYLIARKRIGKTDDISLEFDKLSNNVSFINSIIPYLKGALIYIAFIVLSKLLLMITLFLSQYLNIDNNTFNIFSIILLVIFSVSFISLIYFKLKRRKTFFGRLSNIYTLVALIILSSIISYRLGAQIVLPGIDISKIGSPIVKFHTMELNFSIYKILCGFVLFTTSMILFWKNKKYNTLRYTK